MTWEENNYGSSLQEQTLEKDTNSKARTSEKKSWTEKGLITKLAKPTELKVCLKILDVKVIKAHRCSQAQYTNVTFIFVPDSSLGAPAIFVLLVAFERKHTHRLSRAGEGVLNYPFQRAPLVYHQINEQFQINGKTKAYIQKYFSKHF